MNADAVIQLAFAGLAPLRVDRLLERYGTADRVVDAIGRHRVKISDRIRSEVAVSADTRRNQLTELAMVLRFAGDDDYPDRLARYEGHPRWLFTRGAAGACPTIGVIGTRTCTAYGLELAEMYGRVAAQQGWSVVSGLARGIDGAAHRGAVDVEGHCHAVLGSGVDIVYPASHRGLYAEILAAGGMISSEYPPGTPPEAWRFPTRNS